MSFPMMLIYFVKSSKKDMMWSFLSSFLLSFLPSFLRSFFFFLFFFFAWGLCAQLYIQKFLPLSCYQRVFGLHVHTCQMDALTSVWPSEEKLMVHVRQKHTLSLPRFFYSPYHSYPKFKSPHFESLLFEYGLGWVGRS